MPFRDLRFEPEEPLARRAAAGALLFGGAFGIFTAVLLLMLLVGGPEYTTRRGVVMRLDLLTVLYPLGAAVAGGVVGALLPLTRTRSGAAAAGVAALLPWTAAISLCVDRGYAHWTTMHTVVSAGTALVLGLALGAGLAGGGRARRPRWVQRRQRVTSRRPPPSA